MCGSINACRLFSIMPTVDENYSTWNESYEWSDRGEEWSQSWGGSEAQWFWTILPRIHRFLPCDHILEIAPGFGRWTYYLLSYGNRYSGIDLSDKCIKVCQQRFSGVGTAQFYTNDGRSFPMIEANSVDYIFSFDSLVHCEEEILHAYLAECHRILKTGGGAFIHHSSLKDVSTLAKAAPEVTCHWRATSVSSKGVKDECERLGFRCLSQERINWGCNELIDCFTTLQKVNSSGSGEFHLLENSRFMLEVAATREKAPAYSRARLFSK